MTGHHSVYPSQILSMKKSSSIRVTLGEEMDDVETSYEPHGKSLSGALSRLVWQIVQTFKGVVSPDSHSKDDGDTPA